MYRGLIPTTQGSLITVEIDDGDSAVYDLRFPAEEPLVIEWSDMSKQETILGSMATLRILSPGDRTYIGLYTTVPGSIYLRVYKDGRLWWMGSLDTEFYEEPFSAKDNYEVSLSFSDFGILDRMQYALTGVVSLRDVVDHALSSAGIGELPISTLISTALTTGEALTLDKVCVRSDNFTDEAGDTMSLYEVLEGVLLPLGLHIRQWNGGIMLYDLHTVATQTEHNVIEWRGQDQTLGVDSVANSAVVTFSPYADNTIVPEDEAFQPFDVDPDQINLTTSEVSGAVGGSQFHTYYIDYSNVGGDDFDYYRLGFTFHYKSPIVMPSYIVQVDSHVRNYRIVSHSSGDDSQGLALIAVKNKHNTIEGDSNPYIYGLSLSTAYTTAYEPLMTMKRVYVSGQSQSSAIDFIRLQMEMMIDGRYNPFEESNGDNDGTRNEYYNCRAGYVMLPFTATIYSAQSDGEALYHYDNYSPMADNDARPTFAYTEGRWAEGAGSAGSAWLSWYDTQDRAEKSGTQGFSVNRQYIGQTTRDLYESFANMEGGQYIPLPPVSGWLEVVIYRNVSIYDYNNKNNDRASELLRYARWWLVGWPTIDILRRGATMHEPPAEDIVYSGTLDAHARDAIEIDTICGTSSQSMPTARGLYLNTDGTPIARLTRAQRTDSVEQLLIGTLHSQYATRHVTLSGTLRVEIDDRSSITYTDNTLSDVVLLPMSEVWDMHTEEVEMTLVEVTPDEYTTE